jgi:hypothetical protein
VPPPHHVLDGADPRRIASPRHRARTRFGRGRSEPCSLLESLPHARECDPCPDPPYELPPLVRFSSVRSEGGVGSSGYSTGVGLPAHSLLTAGRHRMAREDARRHGTTRRAGICARLHQLGSGARKGVGVSTLPLATPLLLQTYSVGGVPRPSYTRCRPNQRMAERFPAAAILVNADPLGNAWGAGWISRCRHRLDIAGMHPDLGTSFTGRDVWNRPDRVGARHGTFREGRPARLTSHHPGCSVRVNGAGGGMKGTRLGVGFADRLLSFLGPGSDEPPLSFDPYHDPSRPNRRATLSTPWPGRGAVGRFWQRRLVSQRAKTGEKT